MRIHHLLRGGGASRLAAGLFLALHLAATPLAAAGAGGTEVVDPVNGFSLLLPAGWSASVPKRGAVDGATVLRWRAPGEASANVQEGELADDSLKIQLTAVARDRYRAAGSATDGRLAESATRVAGLDAVVSTRSWASGASVLEIAMSAGAGWVLVADVLPAESPRLLEALAILETIRIDGARDELAPAATTAVERAARLLERLTRPAPSALGEGLTVLRPQAGWNLGTGLRYEIQWEPFHPDQLVDIDLLNAEDQVVWDITGEPVGDAGTFEWRVPRHQDLENGGPYSVRVAIGGESAESGTFQIVFACGEPHQDGVEAENSTIISLHMPFQIGTEWTVGGHGSFYGNGFHCNHYDDYYATDWNRGDDEGKPVLAAASGTVGALDPCNESGYGCSVTVDHGNGYSTAYAHLQARHVIAGQSVEPGHHLGDLGDTGNSSAAHLHFRFLSDGVSRCAAVAGPQCPNQEVEKAPQTEKPSPMQTWNGSTLVPADLVDGGTYRSGNGVRLTQPEGGEVLEPGEEVTIAWQSVEVNEVSIELVQGDQRWVLFPNVADEREVEWTVPDTLPCDTAYRIRVASTAYPGINDLSEEFAIDASCGLFIGPPTLPDGIVAREYSQQLVLFGATPPWRMLVGTGALPGGLELSEGGHLHNKKPLNLEAGTAEFTVVARDSAGAFVEKEYTLTIRQALPEVCNGLDDDGDHDVDEDDICLCRTAEYTGFEYHFCDAAVDWYDAERACSARGVELVKIESSNENNWLAAEGSGFNRWIGLTDAATEEDWRWTDGSPLGTFHGWGPAEPNGGTSENCAQLYFENSEWNDLWCGWSSGLVNGFVCQETIVPSDFLCLTGRLIYNDPYYGIFTGPVDHPVELSIDSPGPGWTPIGQLTPNAAGRFCLPMLWGRRYLLSEEVTGPIGHVRFCQTVIEPTDPHASGICGEEEESACEELDDVDFFCGS